MLLSHLRTSHFDNPLGYYLGRPVFTWTVEQATGKRQEAARILVATDAGFADIVFDSGQEKDISSLGYTLPDAVALSPRTRYFWKVQVWGDDGEEGESPTGEAAAWFETAKQEEPWQAQWLTSPYEKKIHPMFYKAFEARKPIASARMYATGLGLYELQINGQKAGDEYLAPFYNDYNNWLQYQVYDVTELLSQGSNAIGFMLGNGWYKGRFGFIDKLDELYGDRFLLLGELRITYQDGSEDVIGTDGSWLCGKSPVLESSIYDGEVYDARLEVSGWATTACDTGSFEAAVVTEDPGYALSARRSPPVRITERIEPVELLRTPAGEDVVDFGQVMTGWVEFKCDLPEGKEIFLQFGELLQHDNFYNENLRSAKEEYRFISRGDGRTVRPFFTFYGFRYMKVTGLDNISLKDFSGCVIHSDMEFTGEIKTSDEKLNKLILNALWGQRGNFLDVPTDCPQRDERMGWTGDAQVFAATASFNMYTPAFFAKYLHDMLLEQRPLDGGVPHVVPDVLRQVAQRTTTPFTDGYGSCAWADAATVIPWTMYLFYGDKTMLAEQYENMKLWVGFIKRQDEEQCGGSRLWSCGFHFADWLALDNPEQGSAFGRTDPYYVASCYYYYSATLTAKAAKALGLVEDAAAYTKLAGEVKAAIQREYFTETGRLAVDTQTAAVMALFLDLAPERHRARTIADLKKLLDDAKIHLKTGFVGTAYLMTALSDNGLLDYAYTLLFNEDYPSWLYEVNMGATTVWERWNSVLPDGLVSDTGMNSMNHYAYGAVVEWLYRVMCGLNPREDRPGFKAVRIAPKPDSRLTFAKADYESASGRYHSGWEQTAEGYRFTVVVPFDAEAEFSLPEKAASVTVNGAENAGLAESGSCLLEAGSYEITAKR
ncbi:MAG: family 78 glycoside hydrolase catalytic domain [Oscillospiraceae bacterium]